MGAADVWSIFEFSREVDLKRISHRFSTIGAPYPPPFFDAQINLPQLSCLWIYVPYGHEIF